MSVKEHPTATTGSEYYTDVEAAELLGIEVEDVRKWVDHQILVGMVVRGGYWVANASVDERVRELRAKGVKDDE